MKTIYLCGPTLYSSIHIGNARSLVFFDVLAEYYRRTEGVRYARNITDVDDKILNLCGDENPSEWVARETIPQFKADCSFLGLKEPDYEPLASEYEHDVFDISSRIGKTNKDGTITLDTSSIPTYGEVSNRKPDGCFALWKGNGRMGWHSECQAMIMSIFGAGGVDIHGGGTDLTFPHHENENAIHRCATGNPIAKEWVRVGSVNISGSKMSKSLGNIVKVSDLSKDWSTETIRTALLMTKYSKPIDWTPYRLREAEKIATPQTAWMHGAEWDLTAFSNGYRTRV